MFLRVFVQQHWSLLVGMLVAFAFTWLALGRIMAAVAAILMGSYVIAHYRAERKDHAARVAATNVRLASAATPVMAELARQNPGMLFSSTARRNPHK
jgi:hypothetical protein